MNLNEGTFVGKNAVADALKDDEFKALKSDEKAKAIATLKQGGSVTTEEDKDKFSSEYDNNPKLKGGQKKLPDTLQKAIISRVKEMADKGYGIDQETGEFKPMSSDDAIQSWLQRIKQDLENKDSLDENITKLVKGLTKGLRKVTGTEYKNPGSDFIDDIRDFLKSDDNESDKKDSNKLISKLTKLEKGELDKDEFNAFIKDLAKAGYSKDEIKRLTKKYNDAVKEKNKKAVKEENEIKLPADTTFTIDLKHLMQKHGKEKSIKLTKALMKKLHDKGKVEVDGTTLVFEMTMDMPKDTPLALPKAPAKDFLGDDGKDYEGGMAKAQMLKMKKYAMALCDMVDDETQLEAWVQAKITKASDYMSAVYHYLDYQNSKMDENLNPSMMDTDEALVSILMSVARLGEESAEQVVDNLTAEDFKKAAMMMIRDVDEREIAKFVLSATKLDEVSKINENRLVPKDEWKQLDIEWEMVDTDESRPDFQSGPLYGTTADGREFESYGYYTEFEGLVVDDDVYEV